MSYAQESPSRLRDRRHFAINSMHTSGVHHESESYLSYLAFNSAVQRFHIFFRGCSGFLGDAKMYSEFLLIFLNSFHTISGIGSLRRFPFLVLSRSNSCFVSSTSDHFKFMISPRRIPIYNAINTIGRKSENSFFLRVASKRCNSSSVKIRSRWFSSLSSLNPSNGFLSMRSTCKAQFRILRISDSSLFMVAFERIFHRQKSITY